MDIKIITKICGFKPYYFFKLCYFSQQAYFATDPIFNVNYGVVLAATGQWVDALQALLAVSSEKFRREYSYLSWLTRCCMYFVEKIRNVFIKQSIKWNQMQRRRRPVKGEYSYLSWLTRCCMYFMKKITNFLLNKQ